MNEVKSILDERRHSLIIAGKKVKTGQWTKLTWKREAGEPELLVEHSSVGVINQIQNKFAETMKRVNATNNKASVAGPNLVISYPSHTRDTSELNGGEPTALTPVWLFLSVKADFRLINLNTAFADALNLHARPLTVTAKVTANSNTISHPLEQVYYAPQGRERYLFTPPVEEWYDVQTDHWDEVEISLKELDDKLVEFQPDSQCLIRLHFKNDYGTRHRDVNMVINESVSI